MLSTLLLLLYASSNVKSPTFALTQSSSTLTSRKYPSRQNRFDLRSSVSHLVRRDCFTGAPLSVLPLPANALRSIPSPFRTAGNSSSVCMATRAAISAPVAVPVIMRGNSPRRNSALTTPRWHRPKMAPPCSTRVLRPKACRVSCMKSSLVWFVSVAAAATAPVAVTGRPSLDLPLPRDWKEPKLCDWCCWWSATGGVVGRVVTSSTASATCVTYSSMRYLVPAKDRL